MTAPTKIINPLPRELADGVFWLGECNVLHHRGKVLHGGNSVFLVAGEEASALVEAANSFHVNIVMDQIEAVLAERDLPEVKYIFVTHPEVPHAGGIGHFLTRFPNAIACGGVSDLHLIFPQFEHRMHFSQPGDRFDLGGTELQVVDAVFRDLPYTRWAFDTKRHVLFAGDGFAFTHDHDERHCGHLTENCDPPLDIPAMMALFAVSAFHWVEYVDIEPYLDRLDELIFEELGAELILPTHGLPIGDPEATMPLIREGLRSVSANRTEGLLQ